MNDFRLMEKFVGDVKAAMGPFGLLGIDPSKCDEATIVASLQSRLARVAAHPQGQTPEADQVRVALHAASTELMNPAMRRRALEAIGVVSSGDTFNPLDEGQDSPTRRGSGNVKPVVQVSVPDDVDQALLRDTRILLSAFGGMTPEAHRRLTMLAHAKGVSPEQMQRVLACLGPEILGSGSANQFQDNRQEYGIQQSANQYGASQPQQPLHDQVDPGYLVLDKLIKFGLVAVVSLAIVAGGVYMLVRNKPAPIVPPPVPVTNGVAAENKDSTSLFATKPVTEKKAEAAPTANVEKSAAALAELKKLAGTTGTDAKALLAKLDEVGQSWFEFAPDQAASLQDAVIEGMYRLSATDASVLVDELVARAQWMKDSAAIPGESQVSDAVLACGLLTRLSKEESFPPNVRRGIESALSILFERGTRPEERTFQAGAQASLNVAADRLSNRWNDAKLEGRLPLAWKRWAKTAIAAGGSSRHRVVLLALENLLTNAPDPTQQRNVFDAIGELGAALDIAGDPEVRTWVLRWLVAPAIDASHLFALTSRFADNPQRSAGIDHTLVVPTSATERTRIELRERYAKVWGIGDLVESDKVREAWIEAAEKQLAVVIGTGGTPERIERLRNWAKLNDAASSLWSGNQAEASAAIDLVAAVSVQSQAAPVPTTYTIEYPSDDGMFAARYFSLAPADRVKHINESLKGAEIGPRDAAIVVTEFIRTGTTNIRNALKELIRQHKHDKFLLRAMLDHSALFPRTREMSELIELVANCKLPAPDEPVWRIEVRRAMVEVNLTQMASNKDYATLDLEAESLALGYWQRLGVQNTTPLTPDRVAFKLTERWNAQARVLIATGREPWTVDQLERRLSSRRAQARGIVQKFAAEQFGLAEFLAYTVCNESPAQSVEIKKAIDSAELEIAGQGSVLAQIELLEKLTTRLWLIRFKQQEGVSPQ